MLHWFKVEWQRLKIGRQMRLLGKRNPKAFKAVQIFSGPRHRVAILDKPRERGNST